MPIAPSPILIPSTLPTGLINAVELVKNASLATLISFKENFFSKTSTPKLLAKVITTSLVTPARISLPNSRVMSTLFESTIQAFDAVPSVIKLLLSYNQASEAFASTALCFANIFASSEVDLISHLC